MSSSAIKRQGMVTSLEVDIPDEYLLAIGRVTVNWSRLEFKIGQVITKLLSIEPKAGRIILSQMLVRPKLDILQLLAELNDWPIAEQKKLEKTIQSIQYAQKKRNLVIHGLWAEDNKGSHYIVRYSGRSGRNRASGERVRMTTDDIKAIAQKVASAMWGFDAWWDSFRASSMAR